MVHKYVWTTVQENRRVRSRTRVVSGQGLFMKGPAVLTSTIRGQTMDVLLIDVSECCTSRLCCTNELLDAEQWISLPLRTVHSKTSICKELKNTGHHDYPRRFKIISIPPTKYQNQFTAWVYKIRETVPARLEAFSCLYFWFHLQFRPIKFSWFSWGSTWMVEAQQNTMPRSSIGKTSPFPEMIQIKFRREIRYH